MASAGNPLRQPSSADFRRRRVTAAVILALVFASIAWVINQYGHNHDHVVTRAHTATAAPSHPAVAPAASTSPTATVSTATGGVALDPAVFATGSCIAYPPTQGNRHKTVFLDAGHGGFDPGTTGVTQSGLTLHEKNLTLAVVTRTVPILRADGYRVVVSRTRDSSVARLGAGDSSDGVLTVAGDHKDIAARAICANDAHADVLLSVHFDAGSSPSNAGTLTTYDPARSFSMTNLTLATGVQASVVSALDAHGWDIPNDGVVTDTSVGSSLTAAARAYGHLLVLGPAQAGYFTTPSTMPGALVEPLFITDPFEGTIADSAVGQQALADGISSALERFLQ